MARITSIFAAFVCIWAIDLSWTYQDDCPASGGTIPTGVMNAGLAGLSLLLPGYIFRLKVQLSLGLVQVASLLQALHNAGTADPNYHRPTSKNHCPWEFHQAALLFQMVVMAFWIQRIARLWLAIVPRRRQAV